MKLTIDLTVKKDSSNTDVETGLFDRLTVSIFECTILQSAVIGKTLNSVNLLLEVEAPVESAKILKKVLASAKDIQLSSNDIQLTCKIDSIKYVV